MDRSSNSDGRPKRNTGTRDYSALFKHYRKRQKPKTASSNRKSDPPTEMVTTSELTIKEEPAFDTGSDPQLSVEMELKHEPEDAICKDELIIEDTLEPVEEDQGEQDESMGREQNRKLKEFPCGVCHRLFTTKNTLNQHTRAAHMVNKGKVKRGLKKCPICEYSVFRTRDYFRHIALHQDKESGLWRCASCWKDFKEQKQLRRHVRSKVCTKVKKRKNQRKSNNSTPAQLSKDLYVCAECSQVFLNHRVYEAHIKNVHEPNGLQDRTTRCSCELCGMVLSSKYHLTKHMRIHQQRHRSILPTGTPENMTQDEDGLFQCSECTEKLPSRGSYIAHYRRHMFLKQLDIRCTVCGEYFQLKKHLNIHLKTTHQIDKRMLVEDPDAEIRIIEEKNGSFSCSACKTKFTNRMKCRRHIMSQHSSNFRCEICGMFRQTEAMLQEHKKRHEKWLANSIAVETNENGLFMCYECPKVFLTRFACLNHIRSYHRNKQPKNVLSQDTAGASESKVVEGEGRFPCEECGKILTYKYSLKTHMLIHERQKQCATSNFKCSECGREFSNEPSFKMHVAWHNRKKAKCFFTCLICKMTFASQQSFLTHKLAKHPGSGIDQDSLIVPQIPEGSDHVQINCPECKQKYSTLRGMQKHVQKTHIKQIDRTGIIAVEKEHVEENCSKYQLFR